MRIKLIYGSDTGNTELVTEDISKLLDNIEVTTVADLTSEDWDHDKFILGIPTWYDGELQSDWEDYFNKNWLDINKNRDHGGYITPSEMKELMADNSTLPKELPTLNIKKNVTTINIPTCAYNSKKYQKEYVEAKARWESCPTDEVVFAAILEAVSPGFVLRLGVRG